MKNWKFYHGTSKKAFETIARQGFLLSEFRFHNFLAPHGTYFVPNRPLLARRFAKQAGRFDFSEPLVLEVPLDLRNAVRVLDLTTDEGMNRFYKAYVEVKSLLSINKTHKLGRNTPVGMIEYFESIRDANAEILAKLDEANNAFQDDPRRFNWDTAAIRLIIDKDKTQLIIAAIQEGTSFNFSFSNREPAYHGVPTYHGVCCRDHLEVCVTDLGLIDFKNIRVRSFASDGRRFHKDFIDWITNIDSPDGVFHTS